MEETVVEEIVEEPVVEETVEETVVEEIVEEPVVEETVEEPVAEEVAEEPIVEETAEAPVAEEVAEEPIVEETVEETVAEEVAEAPVVEETVEEPVVEEVAEEPIVEETVEETVAEEVAEAPVVVEAVKVTVAPTIIPVYLDNQGNHIDIKYSRSFISNIIQGEDNIKAQYSELKNHILSYTGVKSRLSWKFDSFNRGRDQIAKIKVRGKTILVYLALDPKAYDESKYHHEAMNTKLFEDVPMLYKIKSDLGLRKAKQLVDDVMERLGIEKNEKAKVVDYVKKYPYEETEALVEKNLVKVLVVDESVTVRAAEKPVVEEVVEEPTVAEAIIEPVIEEIAAVVEEIPAVEEVAEEPVVEEPELIKDEEFEITEEIVEIANSDDEYTGEDAIEVIAIAWAKNPKKQYKYDPNNEKVKPGDIVVLPSWVARTKKEIYRSATVVRGNYKISPDSIKGEPKKIIKVLKKS